MSKSIVVTESEYKKGQEAFNNLRPGYVVVTSGDAEQCLADTITRVNAKAVIVGANTYISRWDHRPIWGGYGRHKF